SQIRWTGRNLTVKTSRGQKRWRQNIRTVGRCNEDYALTVSEDIHFRQQLVERLLTRIMSRTRASATRPAHGIVLLDEDNTTTVFLRLRNQVTQARGSNADEHFPEVGAGDGIKRYAVLTRNSAGKQGFTSAGRTIEQNTAWDFRAEPVV